jgi:hypothetical protein
MSTFTAQILVGMPDSQLGGIIPTHFLFLSENTRPEWILVPENVFKEGFRSGFDKITWIPTAESIMEDALLMIVVHIVRDQEIKTMSEQFLRNKFVDFADLDKDITSENLKRLHEICRQVDLPYKVVITALKGSSIGSQHEVVEKYKMDVEVCTPSFSRLEAP